jgi:hypothetical protein
MDPRHVSCTRAPVPCPARPPRWMAFGQTDNCLGSAGPGPLRHKYRQALRGDFRKVKNQKDEWPVLPGLSTVGTTGRRLDRWCRAGGGGNPVKRSPSRAWLTWTLSASEPASGPRQNSARQATGSRISRSRVAALSNQANAVHARRFLGQAVNFAVQERDKDKAWRGVDMNSPRCYPHTFKYCTRFETVCRKHR